MARVVLEHLTKEFAEPNGQRTRAVADVSLTVAAGEFLVLVGPSGCGKTTTLRLIAGLDAPTAGTISIAGQAVNAVPAKDRDVAMVFQNPALYPHMSAYENLAFGLKLRNCPRAEIDRRVREAAELLQLTECLERKPMLLSGGQRQRVALGRAIVRQPKVFLFDEPLSNLDAPMRAQLRLELSKLHRRLGTTMIYVTHDQTEAMTLGHRVAVMREGAIQQVADPVTLYQHPANLFVAGFIGSPPMNRFRGTVLRQGDVLYFEPAPGPAAPPALALRLENSWAVQLAGYTEKPVILGLRPEHISIHTNLQEVPPEPTAEATVEVVEPLGSETLVHLITRQQSFIARVPATQHVTVNQKVSPVFEMSHAQFFDPATEKALG